MTAIELQKDLELAAWELAEAESLEKQAKTLRTKAIKRVAAAHCEIGYWIFKNAQPKTQESAHEF